MKKMSTLKLYHCRDARSLRPLWALEEMKVDYQLINMEFPPRYKYPGYLDINPLGTVPTFIDNNLVLTESTAICQYLVDKYQDNNLRLTPSHPDYGDYLNWLHRSDATFTFPQTIVLRYDRFESAERKQPQVVADYKKWFSNRIRSIETALQGKQYLCANKFTIADICVGYALYLAINIQIDEDFGPNTRAYIARIMDRDAFKLTLKKQQALAKIF